MMATGIIHTSYRPGMLIACIAFGLIILASWHLKPTSDYWNALDVWWFRLANGSLATGSEQWRVFWAIANHRTFDLVSGGGLLLLFAASAWLDHRQTLARRIAIGLFMSLYCVLVIQLVRLMVIHPRLSPTLVLEGANRLSELVPTIHAKDNSTFSFPGDHATVMCLVAIFIWYFCGRAYGIAAFIVFAIFSIPRTVGGAHWATDVIVSSLVIPPIACGLALCTPLAGRAITYIEQRLTPYIQKYLP